MWIGLGLIVGIITALALPSSMIPPISCSTYISVAFLAGLDSVIGGIKGGIEDNFDLSVFVSGFIMNTLLAALITWLGDRVGVDLYMAAIVTFGVRIFNNFGSIRHDIMKKNMNAAHESNKKQENKSSANTEAATKE